MSQNNIVPLREWCEPDDCLFASVAFVIARRSSKELVVRAHSGVARRRNIEAGPKAKTMQRPHAKGGNACGTINLDFLAGECTLRSDALSLACAYQEGQSQGRRRLLSQTNAFGTQRTTSLPPRSEKCLCSSCGLIPPATDDRTLNKTDEPFAPIA